MTENERSQIIELFKKNGISNCSYGRGDFFLFKGRLGQLYLKENSMYIGFYGKDYFEMRKWADARLRDVISRVAKFNGWDFEVGESSAKGDKAVWFTLKHSDSRSWFGQRNAVVGATVELYKILEVEKIFDVGVNVVGVRDRAVAQGETIVHTSDEDLPSVQKEQKYKLTWNGWDAFRDYWDKFVEDWYNFISRQHTISEESMIRFGRASCINIDELPEPYMGCPDDDDSCKELDAVILNLNPGMSQKDVVERQKFYSADDDAWQIRKFKDECGRRYSKFIKVYNCLSSQSNKESIKICGEKICGYDWWIAKKGARVEWLKRVYEKPNLDPGKVFALELCPFHSKDWKFDIKEDAKLCEGIIQYALVPALIAVSQSNLKFAVAIGAPYRDIMEQLSKGILAGVKVKLEEEWYCRKNENKEKVISENVRDIWPVDNPIRSYNLYKVSINDYAAARLLVTWTQSSNVAPSSDFNDVETAIRNFC